MTNNTPEVTAADREAFKELNQPYDGFFADHVATGRFDDHSQMQLLARHRHTSTTALEAEILRLRIFAKGVSSLPKVINRTDGPHRVKVDGEWYEGPVADAYIKLIDELASGARLALTTPSHTDSGKGEENTAALEAAIANAKPGKIQRYREAFPSSGDAVREALATVEFPYQATFNAIGDAIEVHSDGVTISVAKFQQSLRDALNPTTQTEGEGCDVCSGDCGAANPPVLNCPMRKEPSV